MSANASLLARSLAAVWHPCTQMKHHEQLPLIPIARGEGAWLIDMDGRRYLDGISSWWVNLFGHSHPHIQAALVGQLGHLDHVMLAGFTHAPVVELSERLAALTSLGHAFYGSDGAAATEVYAAEFCGLECYVAIVHYTADEAHVFGVGVVRACFTAGAGEFVEYYAFAKEGGVFLFKGGCV